MKVQCRVGVALLALLAVAAGDSRLCARQAAWQPSPGYTQVPIWPSVIPDAQPVNGPEVAGTVVDAAGKPMLIALFGAEEGRRSRGDAHIYEWRACVCAATNRIAHHGMAAARGDVAADDRHGHAVDLRDRRQTVAGPACQPLFHCNVPITYCASVTRS